MDVAGAAGVDSADRAGSGPEYGGRSADSDHGAVPRLLHFLGAEQLLLLCLGAHSWGRWEQDRRSVFISIKHARLDMILKALLRQRARTVLTLERHRVVHNLLILFE